MINIGWPRSAKVRVAVGVTICVLIGLGLGYLVTLVTTDIILIGAIAGILGAGVGAVGSVITVIWADRGDR